MNVATAAAPATSREYISVTDTAVLLRKALRAAFPGTTFSVRSSSYAGGASVRVKWEDGPTQDEVEMVAKPFAGASFDGSIDLKSYHTSMLDGRPVHFGADYVFCNRVVSMALGQRALRHLAVRYGAELPESLVKESGCGGAYVDAMAMLGGQPLDREWNHVVNRMRPNGCIVTVKSR